MSHWEARATFIRDEAAMTAVVPRTARSISRLSNVAAPAAPVHRASGEHHEGELSVNANWLPACMEIVAEEKPSVAEPSETTVMVFSAAPGYGFGITCAFDGISKYSLACSLSKALMPLSAVRDKVCGTQSDIAAWKHRNAWRRKSFISKSEGICRGEQLKSNKLLDTNTS